jgi:hypothetical protein
MARKGVDVPPRRRLVEVFVAGKLTQGDHTLELGTHKPRLFDFETASDKTTPRALGVACLGWATARLCTRKNQSLVKLPASVENCMRRDPVEMLCVKLRPHVRPTLRMRKIR